MLICIFGFHALILNAILNTTCITLIINTLAKLTKKNAIIASIGYVGLFVFSLILTLDLYYLYEYQNVISVGVFSSILETNITEAQSVMSGSWHIAIIIFILVFTSNLFAMRESVHSGVNGLFSFILVPIIFVLALFNHIYQLTDHFDEKNFFYSRAVKIDMKVDPVLATYFFGGRMFPVLFNDLFIGVVYGDEMRNLRKFNSKDKTFPEGLSFGNSDNLPTKIYLVIGESSYKGHYSLYGYKDAETTPFLDSLSSIQNSPLDSFNVISPACITRDVLRMTLTFSTPQNKMPFFNNKSLIDLAREKDYETVWLSNQARAGITESYITLIARSCDEYKFLPDSVKNSKLLDDLNLIDNLNQFQKEHKKQFIVLHMRGSHDKYADGYDVIDEEAIPDGEMADYDRSIHHTDRFFRKLYNYVNTHDDNAIIYYYSDHGELVNVGHGISVNGKEQYQVPLLTINHNTNIPIDSIVSKYTDETTGLMNSLSSISVLSEFMGYKSTNEFRKKEIEDGKSVYNPVSQVVKYKDIEPFDYKSFKPKEKDQYEKYLKKVSKGRYDLVSKTI